MVFPQVKTDIGRASLFSRRGALLSREGLRSEIDCRARTRDRIQTERIAMDDCARAKSNGEIAFCRKI